MSVISFIEHYQRSIKKSDDDESRLLHCLEKLANLQVKVSDLQATGIGRTVNSLRKKPGKVGETVRSLVAKWMEIVESHMTEDEEAQDHSGDECDAKENGHSRNKLDKRMFLPENGNLSINGQDCIEKEMSLKNHHSTKRSGKDDEIMESKTKHRHSDDRKKQDVKHHNPDQRHESSRSRHKSSREEKDRNSSSSKRHRDDKSPKKIKKELDDEDLDYTSSKKLKISNNESALRIKEERVSPETINIKKEKHRDHSYKVKKERSSPDVSSTKKDKFEEKVKIKKEASSPELGLKIKKERSSPEAKVKREKNESKPSTSRQSSHVKIKKEIKQEDPPAESEEEEEITGNGGTSFADALGNLDYTPTKKNKEKKKKLSSKSSSSFKPLPRSEELASMLDQPALTYRPLPHVPFRSVKPSLSEVDALSAVIGNKNQRTKVYSGTKAFHGEVPTLQDMCIKILQENIDALEHVGSVPYFLLEPVFCRASAHQLVRLEHYNQQFVEDFDDLWKALVNTEFKTATPVEYECWREVYERSLGEREHKMAQLAAKIKANNEARKAPQRTTKLAFEHSLVKPPRNVRKQQEKHGTARGSLPVRTHRPDADSSEAGPSGLSSRDRESTLARTVGLLREGPSTAIKGKKRPAPLMQKTLKFMKTNFRR